MPLHLDKDAGRCRECKTLCTLCLCLCLFYFCPASKPLPLPHTLLLRSAYDSCSGAAALLPVLGMSWTLSFAQWMWDRNGSGVPVSLGSTQDCVGLLSCHVSVVARVPTALRGGDVFTAGGFGLLTGRKDCHCEPSHVAMV